jgi:hypothetical protein
MNLTYYGVFVAGGVAVATATVVVLLGALSIPLSMIGLMSVVLLGCCVPAAGLIAKAVEARANTFTIGGSVFLGILIAPWTLLLTDRVAGDALGVHVPMLPSLAVLAIAYAFGEGTGRLACISFGCCYGKPLSQVSPRLTAWFRTRHFTFAGATKKAAYEGGLEMVPVIPIQAITALVFVGAGLVGLLLFLYGRPLAAFLVAWLSTQIWRTISEFFRSDYRGEGTWSVYQRLAIVGALYGAIVALVIPRESGLRPDLLAGLHALWTPSAILAIQGVWIAVFLYTGRSKVTASTMLFSLSRDGR